MIIFYKYINTYNKITIIINVIIKVNKLNKYIILFIINFIN